MKKIARPRRLFVSGGSQLSPNAALLWRELGVLLAAKDGLTLITGGLKSIANAPDGQTADRMMTEGFLEGLRQHHVDAFERIETMLPDPKLDWNNLTRFEVGRVEILKKPICPSSALPNGVLVRCRDRN